MLKGAFLVNVPVLGAQTVSGFYPALKILVLVFDSGSLLRATPESKQIRVFHTQGYTPAPWRGISCRRGY